MGGDFNCNQLSGCGVVFKVDTSGTETVVHTFADLYGTTAHGGNLSCDAPYGCATSAAKPIALQHSDASARCHRWQIAVMKT
jgi:hypothetical protein